jgi:methanogenic corrinoid protein MtbC1
MTKINDFPDQAKYNIKAVCQKTGIRPVTLRAWERRYQVLIPKRQENGYRLYSERDIAILLWIKKQLGSGVNISAAAAELNQFKGLNRWPDVVFVEPKPAPPRRTPQAAAKINEQLLKALVNHDETLASAVFSDALASFPLLNLFEEVLAPTLVEIGEAWFHGRIQVATEHFASNFFRARLLAIYQSLPTTHSRSRVLIGSAPGELHEIGPMMMAILIRDAGYGVEYLGADLPLEDLALYAKGERPKLIILSATMKDSAQGLAKFNEMLSGGKSKPNFGYGGAAFSIFPELIGQTPGTYLGKSLAQSLASINRILENKA